MGINLTKGQKIDLTKGDPSLSKLLVGLGWDTNKYSTGADFDLDAAVFMLQENKKVGSNKDFIYYGNLKHESGSVEHMGDNLTGGNAGDDEQIKIDLARMPANIDRIAITVTIYDAEARKPMRYPASLRLRTFQWKHQLLSLRSTDIKANGSSMQLQADLAED